MHLPDPALLKEKFTIALPDGVQWQGELYGTRSRECGREILVKSGQAILYCTDECYDFSNARFRLEKWLGLQIAQRQRVPVCDVCREPSEGGQSTAETVLCPVCVQKVNAALREQHDRRTDGGTRGDNAKLTTRGPI